MAKRRSTPSDLSYSFVMGGLAALGIAILIGPVLIVLLTSFTSSQALQFPPPGFSLEWYRSLFDPVQSGHIHTALANSLWVAAVATAFACVIATAAALAMAQIRGARARALEASLMSPR